MISLMIYIFKSFFYTVKVTLQKYPIVKEVILFTFCRNSYIYGFHSVDLIYGEIHFLMKIEFCFFFSLPWFLLCIYVSLDEKFLD